MSTFPTFAAVLIVAAIAGTIITILHLSAPAAFVMTIVLAIVLIPRIERWSQR